MTRIERVCPAEGCGRIFLARPETRTCSRSCANRLRRRPWQERLWAHIDRRGPDDCWPWMAARDKDGYGLFSRAPAKQEMAHRAAWEAANGEPLGDRRGRHGCDNPPCCNPSHVTPGTEGDNTADKVTRGRQARGSGHGRTHLTEERVREFLDAWHDPERTLALRTLAERFDVPFARARHIAFGWSWQHIPRPPRPERRKRGRVI